MGSYDIISDNSSGVRKASECGEVGAEIFLQVPNLIKEINISMLSDENFSKVICICRLAAWCYFVFSF